MAGQDLKKSEILNNQTFLENQLYHVARTPYLIYITDIENSFAKSSLESLKDKEKDQMFELVTQFPFMFTIRV